MFRGVEKKGFYTMERIWFSDKEESNADIVRYMRTLRPMFGRYVHSESVETVFSDLNKSKDDILACSTKTVKYEVNKCEKEGVEVSFYVASDLKVNKDILDEFERAYLDFANDLGLKDVKEAYKRSKIDNYIECDCVLLSKAEKDGVSVYHLYSCGGGECVLNYSVSNFRMDPSKRNLAGRMNKLLHIKDMDWFRERNYTLYDWGNISSSQNPNGIDIFKMSFGGDVVTVYNSFVGNSFMGRLLVVLYKLARKL